MSYEIVSKSIESEQLLLPRFLVMFVVVLVEEDMAPPFFFNKLRGKCVTNEASRQVFSNHSVQGVEFQGLEMILQVVNQREAVVYEALELDIK